MKPIKNMKNIILFLLLVLMRSSSFAQISRSQKRSLYRDLGISKGEITAFSG